MEDSYAPKRAAVVYALLTLIAGLIKSQSAVFGLWFSRRSFERSRGEMITMLYEKMLKRKVIGLQEKPLSEVSETVDEDANSHTQGSIPKSEGKQSASTGKVLNLMRYTLCPLPSPFEGNLADFIYRNDVYEVAQRQVTNHQLPWPDR
jgi:hypothetical protein